MFDERNVPLPRPRRPGLQPRLRGSLVAFSAAAITLAGVADGYAQRITSMIEPCIILGMGVTVALILAAIYLPMFSMGGSVH